MFVLSPGLFQILGILLPIAVVAAVVFVIYWLTHTVEMNKEIGNKAGNRYVLLTVVCILVAGASWIFNFGWLRVFLSLIGFPLFYGALFCFANCKAAARAAESRTMRKYILWSCITYVTAYFCFPDAGDVGEMPVFFSLIRNDMVADIALVVSVVAFVANIVLMIVEIAVASQWEKHTPPHTGEKE